jgi:hypothetical protein
MKHLLIMLLFLVSVTAFSQNQENTSVLSKPVSVSVNNTSRETILKLLKSNYNINFFYSSDLEELKKSLTLFASNKSLNEVLTDLFRNTQLEYTEMKGVIVIRQKIQNPVIDAAPADTAITILPASPTKPLPDFSGKEVTGRRRLCFPCLFRKENKQDTIFSGSRKTNKDSVSSDSTGARKDTTETIKIKRKYRYRNTSLSYRNEISIFSGEIYAYRYLQGNDYEGKEIAARRNVHDRYTMSFNAGLNYSRNLSRNIRVTTGITYLSVIQKGEFNYNQYTPFLNREKHYQDKFEYLLLPVQLGYHHNFKRLFVSASAGISLGLLADYSFSQDNYNYFYFRVEDDRYKPPVRDFMGNIPDKDHYPYIPEPEPEVRTESDQLARKSAAGFATIFSGNINTGYWVTDRLSVFISAGAGSFLTSVWKKDQPLKEKPYWFTGNLGVSYSF